MEKRKIIWNGRNYYLLGADKDGVKYYLVEAQFDCGWYWGIGYIETFTNNRNPKLSKDIRSHEHFDSKILNRPNACGYDWFKAEFPENPFSNAEIWKIVELMKSAYIARHYSDMLHVGGAHYTSNPAKEAIQNPEEYERINKLVIPSILEELYKILES